MLTAKPGTHYPCSQTVNISVHGIGLKCSTKEQDAKWHVKQPDEITRRWTSLWRTSRQLHQSPQEYTHSVSRHLVIRTVPPRTYPSDIPLPATSNDPCFVVNSADIKTKQQKTSSVQGRNQKFISGRAGAVRGVFYPILSVPFLPFVFRSLLPFPYLPLPRSDALRG